METVFEKSDEYEANINKREEENIQIALFWRMDLFWKKGREMCNKLFCISHLVVIEGYIFPVNTRIQRDYMKVSEQEH